MEHKTLADLQEGLGHVRDAPADTGRLELIVARPSVEERAVLTEARLDEHDGLLGDNWRVRGNKHTPDGAAKLEAQVALMSARAAGLIAGDRTRWPLAGDQLYVDFDLSAANLPAGTRLQLGSATLEITAEPHTGCGKFAKRFGVDALKLVNTDAGRALNLRGIFARVLAGATVATGDPIRKLAS